MDTTIADWMKEKAADNATTLTVQAMQTGSAKPDNAGEFYRTTYQAVLATIAGQPAPGALTEPTFEKPDKAEIRKSIKPGGIVSFIDGKPYKTLKRHLTRNGLTPEGYRARYGLPDDYPMVCAEYSAARSTLAKQTGLGQRTPATDAAA